MQSVVSILVLAVLIASAIGVRWMSLLEKRLIAFRDRNDMKVQRLHSRLYLEGEERVKLRKRLAQAETKIRRLESRNSKPI